MKLSFSWLTQGCECRKPPVVDACQSFCKSTSLDTFLYCINCHLLPLFLSECKYRWFTYAISSAEGANFSLTIVVMVQKSNAIRAHCLRPPAHFNYSRAADNYCLAVSDAWLMGDIMTRSHLVPLHPCRSFHRLIKTREICCNLRHWMCNTVIF